MAFGVHKSCGQQEREALASIFWQFSGGYLGTGSGEREIVEKFHGQPTWSLGRCGY